MVSFSATGFERFGVALFPAGIGAALSYAVLGGLGVGTTVSTCVAIAGGLTGARWLSGRLPLDLDGVLRHHPLRVALWSVLGIAAIGSTAQLATFMADEAKVSLIRSGGQVDYAV